MRTKSDKGEGSIFTVFCGRPAGWRVLTDRARPGSAGLGQGCRCGLPLQAWAGAYHGGRPPTAYLLHCALSLAAQCIVIGPVCGGRAL